MASWMRQSCTIALLFRPAAAGVAHSHWLTQTETMLTYSLKAVHWCLWCLSHRQRCLSHRCMTAPPAQLTSTVPATFPSGSLALTCARPAHISTQRGDAMAVSLTACLRAPHTPPTSGSRKQRTVSTTRLPTLFPTRTRGCSMNSAMKSRTSSTHLHQHTLHWQSRSLANKSQQRRSEAAADCCCRGAAGACHASPTLAGFGMAARLTDRCCSPGWVYPSRPAPASRRPIPAKRASSVHGSLNCASVVTALAPAAAQWEHESYGQAGHTAVQGCRADSRCCPPGIQLLSWRGCCVSSVPPMLQTRALEGSVSRCLLPMAVHICMNPRVSCGRQNSCKRQS